jgi:hypothetical protein
MPLPSSPRSWCAVICLLMPAACTAERPEAPGTTGAGAGAGGRADAGVEAALERELGRIQQAADTADRMLHPLPLLRPAQEAALRRYTNAQQLQPARALGIPPGTSGSEVERLAGTGRLIRLADSTRHWVVRELDYSVPYLVPDAEALLQEIGERFHARLSALGLPAFRLEVTSVLRDASSHAALRRVNPNAAAGESTHQFGTTFDLAYNAFAAPASPLVSPSAPEAPWLERHLLRIGDRFAETVAARRSAELQAILGEVLLEMQGEGKVMVTLERLQPVYHMTVARRLAPR